VTKVIHIVFPKLLVNSGLDDGLFASKEGSARQRNLEHIS
jgi:hypothetical protein